MQSENYIDTNKALWNEKTKHHVDSAFYGMDAFMAGATSLKEIELPLLGDIRDKSILHLQCHFGQDTISMARMGAKVTGADLSDAAIAKAREVAGELGCNAEFICCNVYDVRDHLDKQFDIVFTTYGTIGWLPDLKAWAGVIASSLKPGGKLVFVEFHPVIWMFDNEISKLEYSYFKREPIIEKLKGTYADTDAPMELESISWNHGLAEVMASLTDAGLRIESFREYDFSPYNCFHDMVETEPGRFQLKGKEGILPVAYSIRAVKD
jgi:2-polyprenyl-3-methyl-5-hydroxy-6-metoxy-1,4-benzoquinol methylase